MRLKNSSRVGILEDIHHTAFRRVIYSTPILKVPTMLDLATIPKELLAARPAKEGKNVLSPICRLSFPNLFTAKAIGKNPKPEAKKKFSVSLLISPTCDISLLKKMASEAATAEWGDKVRDIKLNSPFLKAEEHKYEGYLPGWTLLRPSAESKPTVVELKSGALIRITDDDPEMVYPGRWATVSLNCFAYDVNGNKGIAFGLNNVMLLNHDDSLGGRMKAEDEFEAPEDAFNSAATGGSTVDDLF